jgi:hypothetical protein
MAAQTVELELRDFQRLASAAQRANQQQALAALRDFLAGGMFTEDDFVMVSGTTMSGETVCHEITSVAADEVTFRIKRMACTATDIGDTLFDVTETYQSENDWDNSFMALQGIDINKIFFVKDDQHVLGIHGDFPPEFAAPKWRER